MTPIEWEIKYNEGIADAFDAGWISARQKGSYKCNGTYAEDYMIFLEQLYLNNFKKQLNMTKIVEDPKHEDSYWRFMKAVKKLVDTELEQIEPVTEKAEEDPRVKANREYAKRMETFKTELIKELSKDDLFIVEGKIEFEPIDFDESFDRSGFKHYSKPTARAGTITIKYRKKL